MVAREEMATLVRDLIASVLMVPAEQVGPDTALIADLGAESIDFLDLVFRMEETFERKIPITRWEAFIQARLPNADLSGAITTSIITEFAAQESG